LRDYRLEVSGDGTTFRPFTGDGRRTFSPADVGRVHRIAPDGAAGRDVRYVKITPLAPQDDGCDLPCNGRFEVNVGQLEVFAAGPPPTVAPVVAEARGRPQPPAPPPAAPARAKPKLTIARGGRVTVVCAVRCRVEARLVASRATARRHRLARRLIGRTTLSVATSRRFTVKPARRARRVPATLTVTATYPDGTAATARRLVDARARGM
jgi:hypothetical protein